MMHDPLKESHTNLYRLLNWVMQDALGNGSLLLSSWFKSSSPSHKKTQRSLPMANNSNDLLVPGAEKALNQMKFEIASEFGVNLGAETTSRANGSVGGEITKRLVSMAQQSFGSKI
jgi:hypothetical protein